MEDGPLYTGPGCGIILYIRDGTSPMLLTFDVSLEGFFVELTLRKQNWLLYGSYNPKKQLIAYD